MPEDFFPSCMLLGVLRVLMLRAEKVGADQ